MQGCAHSLSAVTNTARKSLEFTIHSLYMHVPMQKGICSRAVHACMHASSYNMTLQACWHPVSNLQTRNQAVTSNSLISVKIHFVHHI